MLILAILSFNPIMILMSDSHFEFQFKRLTQTDGPSIFSLICSLLLKDHGSNRHEKESDSC